MFRVIVLCIIKLHTELSRPTSFLTLRPRPPVGLTTVKFVPGNVMISDDGNAVLMDFGSVIQGRCKISSRREAIAMQVRIQRIIINCLKV